MSVSKFWKCSVNSTQIRKTHFFQHVFQRCNSTRQRTALTNARLFLFLLIARLRWWLVAVTTSQRQMRRQFIAQISVVFLRQMPIAKFFQHSICTHRELHTYISIYGCECIPYSECSESGTVDDCLHLMVKICVESRNHVFLCLQFRVSAGILLSAKRLVPMHISR